mmetsp:Transcript_13226/g.30143  ORF Transcript_13226/g.30143 Transcript_13226/m.30143 type:complete len:1438 (-) Transcript_13226:352-4665(-)
MADRDEGVMIVAPHSSLDAEIDEEVLTPEKEFPKTAARALAEGKENRPAAVVAAAVDQALQEQGRNHAKILKERDDKHHNALQVLQGEFSTRLLEKDAELARMGTIIRSLQEKDSEVARVAKEKVEERAAAVADVFSSAVQTHVHELERVAKEKDEERRAAVAVTRELQEQVRELERLAEEKDAEHTRALQHTVAELTRLKLTKSRESTQQFGDASERALAEQAWEVDSVGMDKDDFCQLLLDFHCMTRVEHSYGDKGFPAKYIIYDKKTPSGTSRILEISCPGVRATDIDLLTPYSSREKFRLTISMRGMNGEAARTYSKVFKLLAPDQIFLFQQDEDLRQGVHELVFTKSSKGTQEAKEGMHDAGAQAECWTDGKLGSSASSSPSKGSLNGPPALGAAAEALLQDECLMRVPPRLPSFKPAIGSLSPTSSGSSCEFVKELRDEPASAAEFPAVELSAEMGMLGEGAASIGQVGTPSQGMDAQAPMSDPDDGEDTFRRFVFDNLDALVHQHGCAVPFQSHMSEASSSSTRGTQAVERPPEDNSDLCSDIQGAAACGDSTKLVNLADLPGTPLLESTDDALPTRPDGVGTQGSEESNPEMSELRPASNDLPLAEEMAHSHHESSRLCAEEQEEEDRCSIDLGAIESLSSQEESQGEGECRQESEMPPSASGDSPQELDGTPKREEASPEDDRELRSEATEPCGVHEWLFIPSVEKEETSSTSVEESQGAIKGASDSADGAQPKRTLPRPTALTLVSRVRAPFHFLDPRAALTHQGTHEGLQWWQAVDVMAGNPQGDIDKMSISCLAYRAEPRPQADPIGFVQVGRRFFARLKDGEWLEAQLDGHQPIYIRISHPVLGRIFQRLHPSYETFDSDPSSIFDCPMSVECTDALKTMVEPAHNTTESSPSTRTRSKPVFWKVVYGRVAARAKPNKSAPILSGISKGKILLARPMPKNEDGQEWVELVSEDDLPCDYPALYLLVRDVVGQLLEQVTSAYEILSSSSWLHHFLKNFFIDDFDIAGVRQIAKEAMASLGHPYKSMKEPLDIEDVGGKSSRQVNYRIRGANTDGINRSELFLRCDKPKKLMPLGVPRLMWKLRYLEANRLFAGKGFAPAWLTGGTGWHIEDSAGGEDLRAFASLPFREGIAKELGTYMAQVHQGLDTRWFNDSRQLLCEHFNFLAREPHGSHVWWHACGLEAFVGISKEDLEDWRDNYLPLFNPISLAGKRIVTCHGDFTLTNIVQPRRLDHNSRKYQCIDLEHCVVTCAIEDLTWAIDRCFKERTDRKEFAKAYLAQWQLPAKGRDAYDLMFDALCWRMNHEMIMGLKRNERIWLPDPKLVAIAKSSSDIGKQVRKQIVCYGWENGKEYVKKRQSIVANGLETPVKPISKFIRPDIRSPVVPLPVGTFPFAKGAQAIPQNHQQKKAEKMKSEGAKTKGTKTTGQ